MAWGSSGAAIEKANRKNGRHETRSASLNERYPMYCVNVKEVLQWTEWTTHQELLARGKLRQFDESMWGKVFFLSHQWTSYDHPDPENAQLDALQSVLTKLAAGEMEVKGNFFVEFMYGLKHSHSKAEWKTIMEDAYLWIDFVSMPQPLAALPKNAEGDAPHAGQVSDHRLATDDAVTADVSLLVEQLKAAVDSIPSYIEKCAEMIVLVPSVKHADRTGEVCDFNTWRQRGWCRMEFVSSRLACGHDIPVMIVNSRETTPSYFNPCDTMKLFAGNGNYTVSDDKYKVRNVLEQMIAAKADTEFAKGNFGLARGHLVIEPVFLSGLPTDEETATAEAVVEADEAVTAEVVVAASRAPTSELAQLKTALKWRDDATEKEWMKATGLTLLHAAAGLNKLGAARELLSTPDGAAMLNVKVKGVCALDSSEAKGSKAMSATNLKLTLGGASPLATAMMASSTSPEMIQLLINAGAVDKGHLAFLHAGMSGSLQNMRMYDDCMRKGMRKGMRGGGTVPAYMNVTHMIAMGGTVLHMVAMQSDGPGQLEKLEWLLANGASPSLLKRNMLGFGVLACLASNQEADPKAFDLLVAHGCDPNEKLKPWKLMDGVRTFLKFQRWRAPRKYSAAGVMIDAASGGAPLHLSAYEGHLQNMSKLAEHGARPDVRNRDGRAPVQMLEKVMPDSHAPALLGEKIMLPKDALKAKLRGAALITGALAVKAKGKAKYQVAPMPLGSADDADQVVPFSAP